MGAEHHDGYLWLANTHPDSGRNADTEHDSSADIYSDSRNDTDTYSCGNGHSAGSDPHRNPNCSANGHSRNDADTYSDSSAHVRANCHPGNATGSATQYLDAVARAQR